MFRKAGISSTICLTHTRSSPYTSLTFVSEESMSTTLEQMICYAKRVSAALSLDVGPVLWAGSGVVEFSGKALADHPRRAQVRCAWNESFLFVSFEVDSCRLHAKVQEHDGDDLWLDDGV